jgi:large subunit ribosomal protein L21
MYAIVVDGGRQYKVREGQLVQIDYRQQLSPGDTFVFQRVLACSDGASVKIGRPELPGAKVTAQVLLPTKGPKLVIQRFRRRKNSRRRTGHRQLYHTVRIEKIELA